VTPRILFGCRQACSRIVVALLTGDDVNVVSVAGQMESKVAENLTGGGVVGVEEAVEKNDALHGRARPVGNVYGAFSCPAQIRHPTFAIRPSDPARRSATAGKLRT
jgi:hypothetical protein